MINKWNFLKDKFSRFQGIALIGSTDVVGTAITSIFWLYLPTILSSEGYGELHYILSIASIGYVISLIGTRDVITIFTSKSIEINATLYFLSLFSGMVVVLILTLILEVNSMIILLAFVINDLGIAFLLGKKFYKKYSIYVLTQKLLSVLFGISFYFIFGIDGILIGLALSYIHFSILIYREFINSRINFQLLKKNSVFVINNYSVNVIGAFKSNFDKILIGPLLGFTLLGNYALSMQVFAVLMLLTNIVFKYILAHDADGSPTKKLKIITILLSTIIASFGVIVIPYFIPLFFPNFSDASLAIQIISLAVIPATIGQMQTSGILGKKKSSPLLISRIITIVIMFTGIFTLGIYYELQGVALSYLISSSFQAIFLTFMSRKYK